MPLPPPSAAVDTGALRRAVQQGVAFLAARQGADGSWRGDYGGPMFLLPMYVAAATIARREIPIDDRQGMIRYLLERQLPDGSVGLHANADAGAVFTTTLTYVALRLLGVPPDAAGLRTMRRWIQSAGSPLLSASWGKWILAALNLYDYRGVAPVLPELFLLPAALPIHPSRFWCHARQVYLPTAWLYGSRAAMPVDDTILQLRSELYAQPWESIDFPRFRYAVAATDQLAPVRRLAALAARASAALDAVTPAALRRRALRRLLEDVEYEDRSTSYYRIGPVNAVLNTLVHEFRGAPDEIRDASWEALNQYLQRGADGVKMNGYLSTSLWDTAFACQALLETPSSPVRDAALQRAGEYIRNTQIQTELPDAARFYRDPVLGGWPFCDRPHGWPITDCTAEGLKAMTGLAEQFPPQALDATGLYHATSFLLRYQNPEGGWGTYERRRGGAWLEALNPSQLFCDIMIDYSFTECTSACVQALARVPPEIASRFEGKVARAIARGARFLRRRQRADGSWEGAWGICFTYGGWFGVSGLLAAGVSPTDPSIQRAADFLLQRQNPDGGWGEHAQSCRRGEYVPLEPSNAVNTAWALLTLLQTPARATAEVDRGIKFLADRQLADGDWPPEPMTGVFNRTTAIHYDNYRRYFPVWALARALRCRESPAAMIDHAPPLSADVYFT